MQTHRYTQTQPSLRVSCSLLLQSDTTRLLCCIEMSADVARFLFCVLALHRASAPSPRYDCRWLHVPASGGLASSSERACLLSYETMPLSDAGVDAHTACVTHLSAATAASYAVSRSLSATQPCLLTASRHSLSRSAMLVSTLCRLSRPTSRGNRVVDARATLYAYDECTSDR